MYKMYIYLFKAILKLNDQDAPLSLSSGAKETKDDANAPDLSHPVRYTLVVS